MDGLVEEEEEEPQSLRTRSLPRRSSLLIGREKALWTELERAAAAEEAWALCWVRRLLELLEPLRGLGLEGFLGRLVAVLGGASWWSKDSIERFDSSGLTVVAMVWRLDGLGAIVGLFGWRWDEGGGSLADLNCHAHHSAHKHTNTKQHKTTQTANGSNAKAPPEPCLLKGVSKEFTGYRKRKETDKPQDCKKKGVQASQRRKGVVQDRKGSEDVVRQLAIGLIEPVVVPLFGPWAVLGSGGVFG